MTDHILHFESLKECRNIVLRYGGSFLVKLLSTYCVSPADKRLGTPSFPRGLAQGLQRATQIT